ncbi:RES domain protein [bacterium BMS3Abin02]|nr:RES domain protein [bacterium BMS3Abin02]GBE22484.1 RES domain protein [bacterium BMS3Bbin01]HDH26280.1 RES domain-containing protein [Actinomycetota bacterium]HDK45082.1 RES domain-containing protein [Actinomycetota bacterium]HDL48917.1 RES domain-containing protein [Actinomycetota bacterium]
MITERLRDGRQWLRVADEAWSDPLDPTYAETHGGRWNPPRSFPVLYLNEDIDTARSQIHLMLEGQPVDPEDLDPPFVLVTATLPRAQVVADAVTDVGLEAVGLPRTYPVDESRARIPREHCQAIGVAMHDAGLRGVHCRSAATLDGSGRELAWFPARPSSKARQVGDSVPFPEWWGSE